MPQENHKALSDIPKRVRCRGGPVSLAGLCLGKLPEAFEATTSGGSLWVVALPQPTRPRGHAAGAPKPRWDCTEHQSCMRMHPTLALQKASKVLPKPFCTASVGRELAVRLA